MSTNTRATQSMQRDRPRWAISAELSSQWGIPAEPPSAVPQLIKPLDANATTRATQAQAIERRSSAAHWTPDRLVVSGNMPHIDPERAEIDLLTAWEGIVTERTPETFVVRIARLDDSAEVEEEAEFLLEDLAEVDRDSAIPGALVYWFLGYETRRGRRRRTSEVRIRRLNFVPTHSRSWVEEAASLFVSPDESTPTEG